MLLNFVARKIASVRKPLDIKTTELFAKIFYYTLLFLNNFSLYFSIISTLSQIISNRFTELQLELF